MIFPFYKSKRYSVINSSKDNDEDGVADSSKTLVIDICCISVPDSITHKNSNNSNDGKKYCR